MKESGDHQQARVENTFFRYETMLGSSLRARQRLARRTEVRIACNVLNRILELARPASCAIGA
jgi:hypothetical protein